MDLDQERLNRVKKLFASAEHRCKIVETRTGSFLDDELGTGLLIPSVNQLRYVGQHLLQYVTEGTEDNIARGERELDKLEAELASDPLTDEKSA